MPDRLDDDTPRCAGCLSWKRSGPAQGVCWHPQHHNRPVYEDGACARYEARVIVVRRDYANRA